jgi:hypothetical protein
MQKVTGLLFQSSMVLALMDGRKTQTRRIVKPQFERAPVDVVDGIPSWDFPTNYDGEVQMNTTQGSPCPWGRRGDLVYVRENYFAPPRPLIDVLGYCADGGFPEGKAYRIVPSIHMPRWASRITLRIIDVQMERLHDISEDDACDEGYPGTIAPLIWYEHLWNKINGPGSWDDNQWVWVIDFEVIKQNVDDYLKTPEEA